MQGSLRAFQIDKRFMSGVATISYGFTPSQVNNAPGNPLCVGTDRLPPLSTTCGMAVRFDLLIEILGVTVELTLCPQCRPFARNQSGKAKTAPERSGRHQLRKS